MITETHVAAQDPPPRGRLSGRHCIFIVLTIHILKQRFNDTTTSNTATIGINVIFWC